MGLFRSHVSAERSLKDVGLSFSYAVLPGGGRGRDVPTQPCGGNNQSYMYVRIHDRAQTRLTPYKGNVIPSRRRLKGVQCQLKKQDEYETS